MSVPIKKHAQPMTAQDIQALRAPIARQTNPGGQCILRGKIFNYSPMFYEIAIYAFGIASSQKVSKSRVHIEPCPNCPDWNESASGD